MRAMKISRIKGTGMSLALGVFLLVLVEFAWVLSKQVAKFCGQMKLIQMLAKHID